MKSRSLVLLGVVGVLVGATACDNGKGKGNGVDLASVPDGGSAINLTITIVGDGAVEANGQAICSALTDPCTLNVTIGGSTTVEAIPGAGYQFQSWSCDGQVSTMPVLGLALSSGASCTVTFAKLSETLMVNVTDGRGGTGGVVTSTEGGIACGTGATVCTAALDWGTKTTLTAAPDEFYRFVEWTGDCKGAQASVDVTIQSAVNCTAKFEHVQFPLTLSVVGEGTVTTSSATTPPTDPLACTTGNTGTCGPQLIDTPAAVTITATPAANYRIGAWTGDCTALAADSATTVTMDAAKTCVVTFVLVDRLLVTNTMGGGTISVTPDGTVVDGGRSYTHGDTVELTAIPDENKIFVGWSGDCGGTEPTVTLRMDGDKNCAATFAPTPRQLTVSVVGPGSVTSAPVGIDTAASATSATYDHGTEVVLTASPAANYEVSGWTGDCSGATTTATVTLDADKACVVTFQLVKHPLLVTVIGSGSVASAPAGIDTLAGAYQAPFDYDTDVVLTATANTGATQISFVGWSGDCSGTALTAAVDITTARACTAEFTITPYDLAVAVAPSGSGNVIGQRNGTGANVITCGDGADCSETNIPSNENVVLTATPKTGYRFDRWSGCSTATTATLTVPMNTDKSCTANFVEQWNLTVARQLTNGASIPATLEPGTISGGGVDCGTDCARPTIDDGATVTLTATTNPGFVWKGWSGTATGCSGTTTSVSVGSGGTPGATYTCTGTWDQTAQVASAITPSEVGVVTGAATILVGSNGVGTTATLTRPASSGSYNFTGWSGAFTRGSGTATGCSGTGATATIAITAASADAIYTCTASYGTLWNLAVGKSLTSGSATVDPGAIIASGTINCGTDCGESGLASNANVTLTAPTPAGFVFRGWTGTATGCSGANASVTVSYGGTPGTTYTCNASWDQTASVVGATNPVAAGSVTGSGTVTVGGTGVGTSVVLTRPASSGSYAFTSWSGAFTSGTGTATGCSGNGANATVQITSSSANAVYTCTASYTTQWNLTIAKSLTSGATITAALDPGLVTGSGAGISCGSDCNENAIAAATNVTLNATTAPGFVWKGWTGTATGCSGAATSVTVSYGGTPGATYSCNPSWDQLATVVGAASPVAVGAVSGSGSVIVGDATTGTSVTLTRPANSGSYSLTSWSGAFTTGSGTATGCSGTGATVTVRISDATANAVYTCTASYSTLWNLAVSKSLSNGATITTGFDPGAVTGTGINCGSDCSESGINASTSVTLDAPVGGSFAFRRWTGTATGCSGTASSVTVSSGGVAGTTYTCNAEWDETATVVGATNPAAVGAISGGGIVIVGDATTGTSVNLTKPANNGTYRFTSWSGAFTSGSGTATGCSGSGATATVRITSATAGAIYTCTASYDSLWNLTVAKTLTNGAVVSAALDPGAVTATGTINCGADCSENGITAATTIQLSAPSSAGFAFVGWTGTASGCTGSTPTITVGTGGTAGTTYTCNPSWNQTATIVGTANPTAAGSVTGGGTVVVGNTAANTVTLTRPASSGSYNFTGWSGTFTQGTGAATGCTGAGGTTTVAITSASADAIYTCTATYSSLWNLSVSKSLTNGVAVPATLDPGAVTGGSINCGATCTQSAILSSTNITLTAPTPAGYTFRGWSGTASGCSGATPLVTVSSGGTAGTTYTCNASWDQTATIVGVATPAAVGAVTGGTSIVVGGPNATTATLSRPAASASYAFVGWSGTFTSGSGAATGCNGTGLTTNVSITNATSNAVFTCTATYNALWNLSVGKSLTNAAPITATLDPGAVTASGTINCGADCSESGLTAATTVQLTAPTSATFSFVGWTGTASGCTGNAPTITVGTGGTAGTTYTCNASWNQHAPVIGATSPVAAGSISGGGSVIVGGSGTGASVTLTRPAASGSYAFVNWTGAFTQGTGSASGCSGTALTATVAIASASADAIYTCTANYNALWNLSVGKSLTNGVAIATRDPGAVTGGTISCGATCSQSGINASTNITLTAPTPAGFAFRGWSGTASGCSGVTSSVVVSTGGTAGTTYTCNASWDQTATVVGAANPAAAATISGGGSVVVGGPNATTAVVSRPASTPGYAFVNWTGAFTSGTGTATGCSGTALTATVSVTTSDVNAIYTCTANYNALWNLSVGKSLTNGVAISGSLDPGAVTATGTINCGTDCTENNLTAATTIQLTAPSAAGFSFVGWTGTASGCTGNTPTITVGTGGTAGTTYTCNASWNQTASVVGTASPAAAGSVSGSGTVVVGSTPANTLTLTRPASTGSYNFTGWSGTFTQGSGAATGCSGTALTTTVTITSASANAIFTCTASYASLWNLTVGKSLTNGSATLDPGTITGTIAGPSTIVSCGADCGQNGITTATTVTLTAPNAPSGGGYVFLGWTGTASGCSGTAPSIDVTYGGTAGATYSCNASWRQEAAIVGASSPVAAGTVSGGGTFVVGPSGVGTTATLTRPAPSGYQFTGWSGTFTTGAGAAAAGSCSGTGATTTVRLDSATANAVYTCTANFNILWSLSVGKTLSNGAALDPGAVTGTGINCGADCGETNLVSTTTVALTAPVTSTSYTFRGWSGTASGCTGTANPVTVGYNGTPGTTYTCNALYDQNVAIVGVGSPAAGSNGVTPASTTATVGANPIGTQVTIDRGTLSTLYRFVGWSGAFTVGSGTVEAGSCSGTGATTTVRVLTATASATYRCTATFQQRGIVNVTAAANGSTTVANTTPPVSDPNYCAPGASCTVDASTTVQLNATPNSGYRFLNWTGATCSVASTTTASTTLTVTGGTTHACTANFRRIYTINVRVVPAPTAVDRFGSVSAPCTVSTTQSSCTTTVDTGGSITLNAAEYLVSAQRHSRFVRWICNNGTETTAITGQTITNITSDITCVAQFYGLWSRYYQSAPPSLNSAPNAVDLPIATLPADGLPNSSSHFVVDGNELTSPLTEAAAFVAADNEVGFPALSNRGVPTSAFSVNRTLTNGVEEITTIGRHTLSPGSGTAARYRAAFWPFGITRSATTGVENTLTREDFTEYTWVPPIIPGFTMFWDSYLQNGAYRAGTGYALGGTRGLTYRYALGAGFDYQTVDYGWVFRTNNVGTPQQSSRFAVPGSYENGTCATEQPTNVLDVLWDTDPANVGGVVAVGTYTTAQNNTYAFIAKFNSALTLLAPGIRLLVPSGNGNLTASSIVPAIGGGGYAVFGTFTNNTVAMMLISYNLGAVSLDDSYSIIHPTTGAAMTTIFGDVVAETNRYVVVGGVFDGAQYDTQAMFFAADGSPQGGMQIGSPTLWEVATRIIKPRDGGYLISGTGYLSMTAPVAAAYWLTRTDENFFVPFNGSAPSNAAQSLPPARIGRGDLKLTGAALPCPAAWFDKVLPTVNTATATESSFNATVNVQAP